MKNTLFILFLSALPTLGFCSVCPNRQIPDSVVISCQAPLRSISLFKIVLKSGCLSVYHADNNNKIELDYVSHNIDTINMLTYSYNEFCKVKEVYLDSTPLIIDDLVASVVVTSYHGENETITSYPLYSNRLYPYSFTEFLAMIYGLLSEHVDKKIHFPFETGLDGYSKQY